MSIPSNFIMNVKSLISSKLFALTASVLLSAVCLQADAIRVPEQDVAKSIVQKVKPEFPAIAKQLKLSGRVVVDLTVAEDGTVEKADIIAGNPILGNAAKTAGKNWKFTPFQADGKPSKAMVRVNFDFAN